MTSRLAAVVAIVLSSAGVGCSYLEDRGRDFGDIFRLEASVGVGLQAHVVAGEIGHVGLGSSRRYSAGWRYGEALSERRVEDHFPVSYIITLIDPGAESLHSLRWGDSDEGPAQHRCYMAVPGELQRGQWEKDPIHYFDIEVGVMAAIAGVEIGFSVGEFVDFLGGLLLFDLAEDDGYLNRERKRYWRRVAEAPSIMPRH